MIRFFITLSAAWLALGMHSLCVQSIRYVLFVPSSAQADFVFGLPPMLQIQAEDGVAFIGPIPMFQAMSIRKSGSSPAAVHSPTDIIESEFRWATNQSAMTRIAFYLVPHLGIIAMVLCALAMRMRNYGDAISHIEALVVRKTFTWKATNDTVPRGSKIVGVKVDGNRILFSSPEGPEHLAHLLFSRVQDAIVLMQTGISDNTQEVYIPTTELFRSNLLRVVTSTQRAWLADLWRNLRFILLFGSGFLFCAFLNPFPLYLALGCFARTINPFRRGFVELCCFLASGISVASMFPVFWTDGFINSWLGRLPHASEPSVLDVLTAVGQHMLATVWMVPLSLILTYFGLIRPLQKEGPSQNKD